MQKEHYKNILSVPFSDDGRTGVRRKASSFPALKEFHAVLSDTPIFFAYSDNFTQIFHHSIPYTKITFPAASDGV
jgi:hypothetical protein